MSKPLIEPRAKVHLIGICGTGMGALAGILAAKGFRVTGSDAHAYPPMSTELTSLGIEIMEGYRESNLDHNPDLVVVGNICRPDHPEAVAAKARGLRFASMPGTIKALLLNDKRSIVVTGTHGKTTTTSLISYLLFEAGLEPSFLAGGVMENFGSGYRLGSSDLFVIEGDEYDSAYFEKVPKFLSYKPFSAVITSVEHDHVDIYPTFAQYKKAFASFASLLPQEGKLAVYAGDPIALEITKTSAAEVVAYAIEGDEVAIDPQWKGVIGPQNRFDLFAQGQVIKSIENPLVGRHNLRNILAAMVICHRVAGVPIETMASCLKGFKGVRRRQQLLGTPKGIAVYDDFAHHPTAVKETLKALSESKTGRMIAVFEPRSATACRDLHQQQYTIAFDSADRVIVAPPGRTLKDDEMLDTSKLATDIRKRGIDATSAACLEEVFNQIVEYVRPGDKVVLLSNGAFGGLSKKILDALS